MRATESFAALAATLMTSFCLVALAFLTPVLADAADRPATGPRMPGAPSAGSCTCPDPQSREKPKLWHIPKLAEHAPRLEPGDELAALEAIHFALSEVGDGATFIWHRRGGRLNGLVSPQRTYLDPAGTVCRELSFALTAGPATRRIEGTACRLPDKSWQLKG